ncbi:hypothetical protein BKA66DRAFT_443946 [Pyrenochaeta sp. MPI-SDFR-AT-0127]|nr:hypothetical protein BKA66DRAFT_443946 [Pyrenochaeta sp. MPI-SDFR-AT-0127]
MSTFTSSTPPQSLGQVIAIPATEATLGSPFLRAYPLELQTFDIPTATFLQFLDGLNRVIVVSPPVDVLGLVGSAVGLVPEPTAQIVGGAVEATAAATGYGMSKIRSETFIRQANEEIFAPRGLRVDIVKLDVVALVARIPILDADGKITNETSLLPPIDGGLGTLGLTSQQRRLAALASWTGPLELMPSEEVIVPDSFFSKMNAKASERQCAKEEAEMQKKRKKALEATQKRKQKAPSGTRKKKPDKMQKSLQRLEEKRTRVQREYDEEMEKIEAVPVKKDKEETSMRKVLWLLIRNEEPPVSKVTIAIQKARKFASTI